MVKRIVKAMVRRNVRQACCDFVGPVEQALRRYFAVRDVSEPGSGAVGWGSTARPWGVGRYLARNSAAGN